MAITAMLGYPNFHDEESLTGDEYQRTSVSVKKTVCFGVMYEKIEYIRSGIFLFIGKGR